MIRKALLVLAGVVALASCDPEESAPVVTTAQLASGTYHVLSGSGPVPPAEEADLLAVTVHLDRAAGTLVVRNADGAEQTFAFSPRPRSAWRSDCATMGGHVDNEVADLSPGPLRIGSFVLESPLVYPKCSATRMLLSEAPDEVRPLLLLDRE